MGNEEILDVAIVVEGRDVEGEVVGGLVVGTSNLSRHDLLMRYDTRLYAASITISTSTTRPCTVHVQGFAPVQSTPW